MRLNPNRFNALLGNLGQSLTWQASFACPCVDAYSGAADPGCPHCAGKGRVWGDPQPSSAGIVSRDIAQQFAPMASLDLGDVMLVLPSDQSIYALGDFDRVTLTDRTEPFSINVIAGVNSLRFTPISVDRVTWIGSRGELVEGDLPCSYEDGNLVWSSSPPPVGVTYSVTGRRNPEYFCWLSLPLDRPHHHGAALPRRILLRRFDLFGA